MKFLVCLAWVLSINESAQGTEIPFSEDALLKRLQFTALDKFHGSEQGVGELRQNAIAGLYNDNTREFSAGLLMKIGLVMQDTESLIALGDYFSCEEDEPKQAAIYYTAAINLHDHRALFKLAKIYLNKASLNLQLAYDILARGADLNDDYCLCALAQHHLDGTFQAVDPLAAFKLYEKSAHNKFDLGITQYAALLNSTKVFTKPDPVDAYEHVFPIHTKDNRARIMIGDLQKTGSVKLYLSNNYIAVAEAYARGIGLPLRRDRAEIFLKKAYLNGQITKAEKRYYRKLIEQGTSWAKPSAFDIFINSLF